MNVSSCQLTGCIIRFAFVSLEVPGDHLYDGGPQSRERLDRCPDVYVALQGEVCIPNKAMWSSQAILSLVKTCAYGHKCPTLPLNGVGVTTVNIGTVSPYNREYVR